MCAGIYPLNGPWRENAHAGQAMMSSLYGPDTFSQHPSVDQLAGSLQTAASVNQYNEMPYPPSGYPLGQYGSGGLGGTQPTGRERVSLLDGIGPEELRIALQHPRTSQFLREQLKLEAVLAAKAQAQRQPQVLCKHNVQPTLRSCPFCFQGRKPPKHSLQMETN